jgi:hypothetical protein
MSFFLFVALSGTHVEEKVNAKKCPLFHMEQPLSFVSNALGDHMVLQRAPMRA